MKKIKIAFFADILVRDYDGCLRTVFHIIDRLPEDRFDVEFFCGVAPQNDFKYKVHSIPKLRIPMNKSYKVALPFLQRDKLETQLKKFDPDIIHITSPSPLGNFAVKYANKHKIPVSTIYHTHFISYVDYYFRTVPQLIPLARKAVTHISRNFYDSCDKVFVPTQEMITDLSERGLNPTNMVLWPRGLDKNIFSPLREDKHKMYELTANTKKNILFASRLVWEKNLKTLINIYREIEKKKLDINMIIAGDGVARKELENKMPKAYFLGSLNQKDLATIYASSDAFVFPSISETYGNVVIEAMASGLPCVIANGGGSRSFIDHGNNGFLCDPNDPLQYLNFAQDIFDNILLKQKIRMNGFKFVREMDWDKLVANYFNQVEELYEASLSSLIAA